METSERLKADFARRDALRAEKNALGARTPENSDRHDALNRELDAFRETFVHECDEETIDAIRAAGILVRVGEEPHPQWQGSVAVTLARHHSEALSLMSATTHNRHVAFGARDMRRTWRHDTDEAWARVHDQR